MTRILAITVGTSLFSSATWRAEGPFADIAGYRRWLEPDLLDSVSRRERMCPAAGGSVAQVSGTEVIEGLRRKLSTLLETDPAEIGRYVEIDTGHPGRYSAEVATLWRCAENNRDRLVRSLERYDRVVLLCDADRESDDHMAAHALQHVLGELSGQGPEKIKVKDLFTVAGPERRWHEMKQYLSDLIRDPVELHVVVSGGYKVYAMAAGMVSIQAMNDGRSVHVYYAHESHGGHTIVHQEGASVRRSNGRTLFPI